jgi:protein TonB
MPGVEWNVAYRTDISSRDRSGAIAAVVAIHAALLFAFLHMSGKLDLSDTQRALKIFNLSNAPQPPPPPPLRRQPKPKAKEGGSAPKNIRSEAASVVAPRPKIDTPPVKRIVATETPRERTAPTQGESNVQGPGTGAGGAGTGTGSGNGGNGPGGGGDNGVAEPPHLATRVLSGSDFGRDLIDQWPPSATVFLRLRIDPRGYVAECMVDRGTGIPAIDGMMCNIAHERLRFRPAVNRSGQAVAGWFGYAQPAPR